MQVAHCGRSHGESPIEVGMNLPARSGCLFRVEIFARRSSLISRSCRVLNSRSTRPLACGSWRRWARCKLLQRRPNWVFTSSSSPRFLLYVLNYPGKWPGLAMALHVSLPDAEDGQYAFVRRKLRTADLTRSIIDGRKEAALWPAFFEPILIEPSNCSSSPMCSLRARQARAAQPFSCGPATTGGDHEAADGLWVMDETMALLQFSAAGSGRSRRSCGG